MPASLALVRSLILLPGIRRQVGSAARRRGGVLIAGEPGTGREAVARAIHAASARASGSFIAIDCAADPHRNLRRFLNEHVDSRAQTGKGDSESVSSGGGAAGCGTLFLRNPFDLPIPLQGQLTRALRDAGPVKSGDGRPLKVKVRPMAAVDFAQAVVEQICQERQVPIKRVTPPALALLSAFPWWGNVVELCDLLDAVVRRATDREIDLHEVLEHVRLDGARAVPVAVGPLREARARFEREYISAVLARHRGRIGTAAVELGLERANLYRKLRQLGVRPARA